ncbi:hypothetical protein MNBD_GAMMA03-858, partial [hydrothermal vent metagenome]
ATLNIPSLRANDCNGQCSWTRTLTNKSNVTETWSTAAYRYENDATITVTPDTFVLAAGASQAITIEYTACAGILNTIRFNEIVLSPSDTNIPSSRITLAATPTAIGNCVLPDLIYMNGFE